MKSKLSVLLSSLIFLALVVTGCKKETDNSMIGKWDVTTQTYTVYENNVKLSEENYVYKPGEFVLVINSDGSGKFLEDGQDGVTFTWKKIIENKFSIVLKPDPYSTQTEEAEIVVNKNVLTWTSTYVLSTVKYQNYIVGNKI
jgi:hypothetical protein